MYLRNEAVLRVRSWPLCVPLGGSALGEDPAAWASARSWLDGAFGAPNLLAWTSVPFAVVPIHPFTELGSQQHSTSHLVESWFKKMYSRTPARNWAEVTGLRYYFFSNTRVYCYKFLLKQYFGGIWHTLNPVFNLVIFLHFKILPHVPFAVSFDLWVIYNCVSFQQFGEFPNILECYNLQFSFIVEREHTVYDLYPFCLFKVVLWPEYGPSYWMECSRNVH